MPKVSVIVPIYNVSAYIERCARTLFEQTFQDIEYIFVNDATPDDSMEILEKVINDYPQRAGNAHIISHTENKGLSAARNTGLLRSRGEYVLHIDSDDFVEKEMIELLYNKAEETSADIVVCDFFFYWGKEKKIYRQKYSENSQEFTKMLLSTETLPSVWNKLIRRSLFFENNVFPVEGINMGEDYALTPRFSYFAQRIAKVEKPLYYYNRTNVNSYTNNYSLVNIYSLLKALRILNDFFLTKPGFKDSLYQGFLVKELDLIIHSSYENRKIVVNECKDFAIARKKANLTMNEKIITRLMDVKWPQILNIYIKNYNFIFLITQRVKGRI